METLTTTREVAGIPSTAVERSADHASYVLRALSRSVTDFIGYPGGHRPIQKYRLHNMPMTWSRKNIPIAQRNILSFRSRTAAARRQRPSRTRSHSSSTAALNQRACRRYSSSRLPTASISGGFVRTRSLRCMNSRAALTACRCWRNSGGRACSQKKKSVLKKYGTYRRAQAPGDFQQGRDRQRRVMKRRRRHLHAKRPVILQPDRAERQETVVSAPCIHHPPVRQRRVEPLRRIRLEGLRNGLRRCPRCRWLIDDFFPREPPPSARRASGARWNRLAGTTCRGGPLEGVAQAHEHRRFAIDVQASQARGIGAPDFAQIGGWSVSHMPVLPRRWERRPRPTGRSRRRRRPGSGAATRAMPGFDPHPGSPAMP